MKSLKQFKRDLIFYFTRATVWFFNNIPRNLAIFLGASLGLLAWCFLPKDRHKINRHLTLVFKDELTPSERNNIARNFFINTGKNLADAVRFKNHYEQEIKPNIIAEGLEHFDRAYKTGQGALGVTGHIGNFELLAAYLSRLGYKIAVIGRELYDPRLDKLLVANREAMGLTNIATSDSPKRFLDWLKKGGAIGVLIDTDSFRVRSMMVPFFNRYSNTPIGQSLIGLKTGSHFVPMACVRFPGNRYKVIIKPAVKLEPTGTTEGDVYQITLKCSQALEEIVRKYKDQWIWLHNRWHTKV